MQFKLSTLMVMVTAVAFGCMGWKLGEWMMHEPPGLTIFVFVLSWCLLLLVLLKGGKHVLLPCFIGFVVHVVLVFATSGPEEFSPLLMPLTCFFTLISCPPVTQFAGSIYLALNKSQPDMIRFLLFMPSCFLLGWFLGVLYFDVAHVTYAMATLEDVYGKLF